MIKAAFFFFVKTYCNWELGYYDSTWTLAKMVFWTDVL